MQDPNITLTTTAPRIRSIYETEASQPVTVEVTLLELDIIKMIRDSAPFSKITLQKSNGVILRVESTDQFLARDGRLKSQAEKDNNGGR